MNRKARIIQDKHLSVLRIVDGLYFSMIYFRDLFTNPCLFWSRHLVSRCSWLLSCLISSLICTKNTSRICPFSRSIKVDETMTVLIISPVSNLSIARLFLKVLDSSRKEKSCFPSCIGFGAKRRLSQHIRGIVDRSCTLGAVVWLCRGAGSKYCSSCWSPWKLYWNLKVDTNCIDMALLTFEEAAVQTGDEQNPSRRPEPHVYDFFLFPPSKSLNIVHHAFPSHLTSVTKFPVPYAWDSVVKGVGVFFYELLDHFWLPAGDILTFDSTGE